MSSTENPQSLSAGLIDKILLNDPECFDRSSVSEDLAVAYVRRLEARLDRYEALLERIAADSDPAGAAIVREALDKTEDDNPDKARKAQHG